MPKTHRILLITANGDNLMWSYHAISTYTLKMFVDDEKSPTELQQVEAEGRAVHEDGEDAEDDGPLRAVLHVQQRPQHHEDGAGVAEDVDQHQPQQGPPPGQDLPHVAHLLQTIALVTSHYHYMRSSLS